jgi:hypothetical protein
MRVLLIAIALTLALSAMALAGANPDAKVAVHVRVHSAKAGCTITPAIVGCGDINTTLPGYDIDAFPVFFDLVEWHGCEYGLCWPDWTYSAAMTNCADFIIGDVSWPGDGASHAWTGCFYGVMVPSFVWLYADAPGYICVCPHPISGIIGTLDCADLIDEVGCNFCAGVYGLIGDDPCEPTGTEPSTWSEIKGMFE